MHTKESQWDTPTKPADKSKDSTDTATAPTKEPEEIQCSHLLVKHKHSRRPASWRQVTITRSKDEALDTIKGKVL